MSESFFYSVKDLSKDKNSVISYFFYKICLNVESFSSYEECQVLYNALVQASLSMKPRTYYRHVLLFLNCLWEAIRLPTRKVL